MEKVDTVTFPVVLSANPWAQGVRDLVKRGLVGGIRFSISRWIE